MNSKARRTPGQLRQNATVVVLEDKVIAFAIQWLLRVVDTRSAPPYVNAEALLVIDPVSVVGAGYRGPPPPRGR